MLAKEYSLGYAQNQDIDSWMKMVELVKQNFPGLEMDSYRQTVMECMENRTALCVKHGSEIAGILLFSYHFQCLACLAVHPNHRNEGIASALMEKMISLFPADMDISVTTFRENDSKGIAPRALYKKFGFAEDELYTEFGYPVQKFILHKNNT